MNFSLEVEPELGEDMANKWTAEEDNELRLAISVAGGRNWKSIASHFSGKTEVQCLRRWTKVLKPTSNKAWTER